MASTTGTGRTAPRRAATGRVKPGQGPSRGPQAPRPPAGKTPNRRLLAAVTVVLVAGAALVLWAWQGRDAAPTPADRGTAASALNAVSGLGAELPPPWPAPTEALPRVQQAGLGLGEMGTAEHYHVHLDVIVNGEPVPVPGNLGVDAATGAMSYLHTHDPGGVVHIEAGRAGQTFTLGQLFTQWDVRLTAAQVGGLHAEGGNTLAAYVDGRKVTGNPARLRLAPHQEIALVYGASDQSVTVPSSYPFAEGD